MVGEVRGPTIGPTTGPAQGPDPKSKPASPELRKLKPLKGIPEKRVPKGRMSLNAPRINQDAPLSKLKPVRLETDKSEAPPLRRRKAGNILHDRSKENQILGRSGRVHIDPGKKTLKERRGVLRAETGIKSKNTGLKNLKDTAAGIGYGGMGGGGLVGGGQGIAKQVRTGTKWTKVPEETRTGKLQNTVTTGTAAIHDAAAPFKMYEYYGDARKVFSDYVDHAEAKDVIQDHKDLASMRAETHDPHLAGRLDREIRLKRPRRIVAEKTLSKRGHFQRIGHTKGIVGFANYSGKTGLAAFHIGFAIKAAWGAKGAGWFGEFGKGLQEGINTAAKFSTLAFSAIGVVFEPVSAAYYTKKAVDNTRKVKALSELSNKIDDVKDKVTDPELRSVVKRLERKADRDSSENRWNRISNSLRAALSVVGAVGSVTGFLAAVGVKAAAVTGISAALTAWPVLLGVAGAAALITSGCLLAKALRNRNSRLEKAVLKEANDRAQAELDKHRTLSPDQAERTQIDPTSEIYHSRVEKALKRTEDLDLVPGLSAGDRDALLARFEAKTLTVADVALIADWTQNMRVARDTRTTIDMLVTRLFEEADAPEEDESGDVEQAHQLLSALGVPDEKVTAIRQSLGEIARQQARGVVDEAAAAEAVVSIEQILSEALLLR